MYYQWQAVHCTSRPSVTLYIDTVKTLVNKVSISPAQLSNLCGLKQVCSVKCALLLFYIRHRWDNNKTNNYGVAPRTSHHFINTRRQTGFDAHIHTFVYSWNYLQNLHVWTGEATKPVGRTSSCVMQQCYPLGGGPPSCSGLLFRHKLTWKAPISWHCNVIKMNM